MKSLRLPFILIFVAFFYVANSNPLLGFFEKRSDDKVKTEEVDDKAIISTSSTAKSVSEAATTLGPSSSCGGLKDFLHICDKTKETEPSKNIKTRSVSEKDSDESSDDSDSDSDDDDDDGNENLNEKEKKRETTQAAPVINEPEKGNVTKRQVGDPEARVLSEMPPVISDPMEQPEKPMENPEEDETKRKRQIDDSDSNSSSDEEDILLQNRQRRDCSDRQGYRKDCRKKREYVPTNFERNYRNDKTSEKSLRS